MSAKKGKISKFSFFRKVSHARSKIKDGLRSPRWSLDQLCR